MFSKAWEGFVPGKWCEENEIDTRDFIQRNYKEYEGDASFLAGPTEAAQTRWSGVLDLVGPEGAEWGVLDAENEKV